LFADKAIAVCRNCNRPALPDSPSEYLFSVGADCAEKGAGSLLGLFLRYEMVLMATASVAARPWRSGELEKSAARFGQDAAAILLEPGFTLHHRTTRVIRQGVRQHLAGLVTNQRINVARRDFDRLKARLTNRVGYGPQSQHREGRPRFRSHLEGRVGFVEMINPNRGKRLRAYLEHIQWLGKTSKSSAAV
jgi:hypothetical protein